MHGLYALCHPAPLPLAPIISPSTPQPPLGNQTAFVYLHLREEEQNLHGHLTETEKMPWSQWRDASNEKHMSGSECSHLNNGSVGGTQRGDAVTPGLSLTEVQCSFLEDFGYRNSCLCVHTNMQTCHRTLVLIYLFHFLAVFLSDLHCHHKK